jgi:hypothetical protein
MARSRAPQAWLMGHPAAHASSARIAAGARFSDSDALFVIAAPMDAAPGEHGAQTRTWSLRLRSPHRGRGSGHPADGNAGKQQDPAADQRLGQRYELLELTQADGAERSVEDPAALESLLVLFTALHSNAMLPHAKRAAAALRRARDQSNHQLRHAFAAHAEPFGRQVLRSLMDESVHRGCHLHELGVARLGPDHLGGLSVPDARVGERLVAAQLAPGHAGAPAGSRVQRAIVTLMQGGEALALVQPRMPTGRRRSRGAPAPQTTLFRRARGIVKP